MIRNQASAPSSSPFRRIASTISRAFGKPCVAAAGGYGIMRALRRLGYLPTPWEGRQAEATLMNAVQFEVEALRDLAKRARDLAGRAKVPHRRDQLLALAEQYEAKAAEIERRGKLPESLVS